MHSAKTLERGIQVIEHQNQRMNGLSPEQVEEQLNVGAFGLSSPVAYPFVMIIFAPTYTEATRLQISRLQAQLGPLGGVDPQGANPGRLWSDRFIRSIVNSIYYIYMFVGILMLGSYHREPRAAGVFVPGLAQGNLNDIHLPRTTSFETMMRQDTLELGASVSQESLWEGHQPPNDLTWVMQLARATSGKPKHHGGHRFQTHTSRTNTPRRAKPYPWGSSRSRCLPASSFNRPWKTSGRAWWDHVHGWHVLEV